MKISEIISVIIPVYNVIDYLDRCLETVINQSYTDLEIVLVDDGSTDGSGALCDAWAQRDPRITAIHTLNGGAAAARNVGLNKAHGEYIMFVDADDYLDYTVCQMLYDALKKHKAECAVAGLVEVDENDRYSAAKAVAQISIMSGAQAIYKRYFEQDEAMQIVGPCGKLFCRSMWENLRFSNGLYYEDLDIMPSLYYDCPKMVFLPEVGYYYYQRSDSASHSGGTDHKRVTDSVLIRQKHIAFFQEVNEMKLAAHMAERLIDLIITSDCNGWIPAEETNHYRDVFKDCVDLLKKQRAIGFKDRIRYVVFQRFGAKFYRKWILRQQ